MNENTGSRVEQWKPQPRPEWVRRVNEEGACLDIRSVVPLDETSLVETAKANTGLDDFGTDDWREPFQVFLESLDEEAELNLMGRILTRSDLLMMLEARLKIEDTYKRHPEIADERIVAPLWILGSGRSGTSALQNLMSLDPDSGSPRHWEALFPCPPPEAKTYHTDPRIPVADARMTQWNRVAPEIASMHEFGGEMPTEMIQLEALAFQSNGWLIFCGFTPTFDAYLAKRGSRLSLEYAKRVLKLLQWKNPRKRWLVKSPDAMRYLPDVVATFPDVQLIWTHRDPLKTMSSVVSLVGTILWMRSDRKMDARAIASLTNPAGLAGLFDLVMGQVDSGLVPAKQLHHVQYPDLVGDPLGTVEAVYRSVGVPMTPAAREAMTKYVRDNPREARPAHRYGTSVDAARQSAERQLFARYMERFGVKPEA